jgi:hypothetical protein
MKKNESIVLKHLKAIMELSFPLKKGNKSIFDATALRYTYRTKSALALFIA